MLKNTLLNLFNKNVSKWIVLFIDVYLICLSFLLSYFIRNDLVVDFNLNFVIRQLITIISLSVICFFLFGSFKSIIRHTGLNDVFNIFFSISTFTIVLLVFSSIESIFLKTPYLAIPKSVIIIHYFLTIFILISSRFFFKYSYNLFLNRIERKENVMIYGAGDSGIITYGALNKDKDNNYHVFGFLDDEPTKINKKIFQTKIFDPKKIDKKFINTHNIKEIIISIQTLDTKKIFNVTEKFLDLGVKVKKVPSITRWISNDLKSKQIKQIKIEDLLGRDQIELENPFVKRKVTNKRILITGAAGSIGSEISRQLSSYDVERLILIDQAESDLYDLQQELYENNRRNFVTIVSDVRDCHRMEQIFKKYKPHRVFHAAAYKHVPLMEENPYEAVKINILGTKNIADLSLEYDIERFVMVSTDKAVNPTNVMGATKRVAEMYIGSLDKLNNKTKFTTTRFGNVLGSNGSVIPLFKRQIENGGPLTVTHKDITRYFMTIPEACSLVLEAGTMGVGGEIYIFDMGESVKIVDLAKRMISLSGLKYPNDIAIKFTGLRPGEKLYEELLANGENTKPTYNKKILIANHQHIDNEFIYYYMKELEKSVLEDSKLVDSNLVSLLKSIVPEFISNNSIFESLDNKK